MNSWQAGGAACSGHPGGAGGQHRRPVPYKPSGRTIQMDSQRRKGGERNLEGPQ